MSGVIQKKIILSVLRLYGLQSESGSRGKFDIIQYTIPSVIQKNESLSTASKIATRPCHILSYC